MHSLFPEFVGFSSLPVHIATLLLLQVQSINLCLSFPSEFLNPAQKGVEALGNTSGQA
jgi:hypothetical protein